MFRVVGESEHGVSFEKIERVLGFSCSRTVADGISEIAALHILGIGAVGGMTLAVMSRAILGHSGRPLVVDRATTAWKELLAAYDPPSLDDAIRAELEDYVARRKAEGL